jgi:hypothetical protein
MQLRGIPRVSCDVAPGLSRLNRPGAWAIGKPSEGFLDVARGVQGEARMEAQTWSSPTAPVPVTLPTAGLCGSLGWMR